MIAEVTNSYGSVAKSTWSFAPLMIPSWSEREKRSKTKRDDRHFTHPYGRNLGCIRHGIHGFLNSVAYSDKKETIPVSIDWVTESSNLLLKKRHEFRSMAKWIRCVTDLDDSSNSACTVRSYRWEQSRNLPPLSPSILEHRRWYYPHRARHRSATPSEIEQNDWREGKMKEERLLIDREFSNTSPWRIGCTRS